MTPEVQWKLAHLPDLPGCYIMRSAGEVIYVGKAVNLKNRVRQYFHSPKNHAPKVRAMVEKVDDFDTVIVGSEFEALALECNLIKLHRPYYNILLKDDKHYPYIAIDLNEPFPRVQIKRQIDKDGLKYFGPYKGATIVREVLDAVRMLFPIRVCEKVLKPNKPLRPCIHHSMGQCLAPCAGNVTNEAYLALLQRVMTFLSGKYDVVVEELQSNMMKAASEMNYERAAIYRDRIEAVNSIMQKQHVIATGGSDQDVLYTLSEGMDAMVECMSVREGKLLHIQTHVLPRSGDEASGDVLTSFVLQHYDTLTVPPKEILISHAIDEQETLSQLLSEMRGSKVSIHMPERGEKKRLIELAETNLRSEIAKRTEKLKRSYARTTGALIELAGVLGLDTPPRRIEGYDISNTQGLNSVGSMVVMIGGVAANKQYRHFRIKTVQGANDFASMHEVLTRRLTHGLEEKKAREASGHPTIGGSFSDLPDLILIDGGRGQLNAALDAMHAVGLNIPMFGLAKRLEEIVLPDETESILLDRHSEALHLIQRLRDEAHRFGITHHRKLRSRQAMHSVLDDIAGIGPNKKKSLLKHFKTIESLKNATEDQLCLAPDIGPKLAAVIYAFFHQG